MNKAFLLIAAGLLSATSTLLAADKKIVMIAGKPSHGYLEHEYRAGCLLLQKCLAPASGVNVAVYTNDWPTDPQVFDGAAAVFVFSTGGGGHPAIRPERLKLLGELMKNGVGF